jgi:hypothetical protein
VTAGLLSNIQDDRTAGVSTLESRDYGCFYMEIFKTVIARSVATLAASEARQDEAIQ